METSTYSANRNFLGSGMCIISHYNLITHTTVCILQYCLTETVRGVRCVREHRTTHTTRLYQCSDIAQGVKHEGL